MSKKIFLFFIVLFFTIGLSQSMEIVKVLVKTEPAQLIEISLPLEGNMDQIVKKAIWHKVNIPINKQGLEYVNGISVSPKTNLKTGIEVMKTLRHNRGFSLLCYIDQEKKKHCKK